MAQPEDGVHDDRFPIDFPVPRDGMVGFLMARTTLQLFREILDGLQSELHALETQKTMPEDQALPTIVEIAAIDRIQKVLRGSSSLIKLEIDQLE